jgi:hypothetical protein
MRASFAVDRRLPLALIGTVEGLYTHTFNAPFFSPVNLATPKAIDRRGRVLYGTIDASGVATPTRIAQPIGNAVSLGSQSHDYAYDVTGQLQRSFGRSADIVVSYTRARDRDVQSQRIVRPVFVDNWRLSRPVAGQEDALSPGISDYDLPDRVRAVATLLAPWARWATEISVYYIGSSGLPYTYVSGGAAGRGDLNADGAAGNDPIYIPRRALDTAEIKFAGTAAEVAAQQTAFERFINGAACLRRQRGRIMARNSCRSPWTNQTNVGLRQPVPFAPGDALTLELQVFNFLNLLNPRWGGVTLPPLATPATTSQLALLSQVGETAGPGSEAQPIYRFDATARRYTIQNVDSYYQIQLGARYSF